VDQFCYSSHSIFASLIHHCSLPSRPIGIDQARDRETPFQRPLRPTKWQNTNFDAPELVAYVETKGPEPVYDSALCDFQLLCSRRSMKGSRVFSPIRRCIVCGRVLCPVWVDGERGRSDRFWAWRSMALGVLGHNKSTLGRAARRVRSSLCFLDRLEKARQSCHTTIGRLVGCTSFINSSRSRQRSASRTSNSSRQVMNIE
jgi:hypothetical protein